MEEAPRYKLFAVRPQRKWLSWSRNFLTLPRPAPPHPGKRGRCPAPKITPGQESGQTFLHHQKFLGVKNF